MFAADAYGLTFCVVFLTVSLGDGGLNSGGLPLGSARHVRRVRPVSLMMEYCTLGVLGKFKRKVPSLVMYVARTTGLTKQARSERPATWSSVRFGTVRNPKTSDVWSKCVMKKIITFGYWPVSFAGTSNH
jgi:hypothetical protein